MITIYLYRNIINGSIFIYNGTNFIEFNNDFLYAKTTDLLRFEKKKNNDIYKIICYFNTNYMRFDDIVNNIFNNIDNLYDYNSGYNLYYKDIIEYSIEQSLIYKLIYINKMYKKNLLNLNRNIINKIYTKILLKYGLNKLVIKKIKIILN